MGTERKGRDVVLRRRIPRAYAEFLSRGAARRRTAQEERQPGQASQALRRRMGDALADLFDEFGPEIYSAVTLALKNVVLDKFKTGFQQLDSTIKEELGQRGVEESRQHIRNWTNELVEDINHFGLDEVAGSLEDYVGTLAAEFQQPDEQEGEDLLEVPDEDLEDVEEVPEEDVEPEPEEEGAEPAAPEAPAGEGELNLEDLGLNLPAEQAAARFGPLGGRRRRPTRTLHRREASRSRRPFGRVAEGGRREATRIPPHSFERAYDYLLQLLQEGDNFEDALDEAAAWIADVNPRFDEEAYADALRRRYERSTNREASGTNRQSSLDRGEDEYPNYEEEDDVMSPDDAIMQVSGRLGTSIDLSIEGRYVDTFASEEEAIEAVRVWAEKNNFYPNLWLINDHGNVDGPVPY